MEYFRCRICGHRFDAQPTGPCPQDHSPAFMKYTEKYTTVRLINLDNQRSLVLFRSDNPLTRWLARAFGAGADQVGDEQVRIGIADDAVTVGPGASPKGQSLLKGAPLGGTVTVADGDLLEIGSLRLKFELQKKEIELGEYIVQ